MSDRVIKAWKTRRTKYGPSGMPNSLPVVPLSVVDKVWLACAFDTEGWVGHRNRHSRQFVMSIEMTSKSFIEKVGALVGQRIWARPSQPRTSAHSRSKPSYAVKIHGDKAKALFAEIRPYMLIKGDRLEA
jgi:hypothetical protein